MKQDKNSKYEKDFTIELNYIADDVSIEDYNVADADTITIDHHTAYYTEEKNLSSSFEKYSSAFPKSLRVFYPEYGYYLRYNAMMHLSKTRLFQIADKITLKEVDASQTDEFEVVDKKYLDLFKEDEEEERTFIWDIWSMKHTSIAPALTLPKRMNQTKITRNESVIC